MGKNVGGIDRIARVVVGLILLALVFVGPQTPWGWIGLVPLLTGLIRWCPLYTALGFNTCPAWQGRLNRIEPWPTSSSS